MDPPQDWKYTYCQNVYIDAALELYRVIGIGMQIFIHLPQKTAYFAMDELSAAEGILPNVGTGYGGEGLFKVIFVLYLAVLALETGDERIASFYSLMGWHYGGGHSRHLVYSPTTGACSR